MRTFLAAMVVAVLASAAACSGPAKKAPDGPAPDDIPQEVTCCITPAEDGTTDREVVPVERCPEDQRNPVDACNVGPGENEPVD
ncbi:MAG TPA: hypothetical protein VM734_34620 [Kofleriaceae bacterium]|jgi:hypothetical protein|nr:hypothetical protein [Kofleriaceae bacterium]